MTSGFLGGGVGPSAIRRSVVPADPVPVAGAELLTNGGFEDWASATNASNWTELLSGTSTINREDAQVYTGTHAARYDVDASQSVAAVRQVIPNAAGAWLAYSFAAKASGAGATAQYGAGTVYVTVSLTTDYVLYFGTLRALAANVNVDFWRYSGSASKSIYVDDIATHTLTLPSLLSTRTYASADCDLSAAITRTAGTQAGLVARLDDATTPANFIIAYLDGATNVKVDKCVGGTYTNVISGAITYVAGQRLRLVCSGNNVSAYYNGAQVGSTVTVSDAGIVSNTRHGKFSTYASNVLANYTAA